MLNMIEIDRPARLLDGPVTPVALSDIRWRHSNTAGVASGGLLSMSWISFHVPSSARR